MVSGGASIATSRQLKEYLLCDDCEGRFQKWETILATLVLQKDDSIGLISTLTKDADQPGAFLYPGPYRHVLTRVALSVFWRAAVWSEKTIELGSYEEPIRKYLLDDAATLPDHLWLRVNIVTEHPPEAKVDAMNTTPVCRGAVGSLAECWFAVCGLTFCLFVCEHAPDAFGDVCFVRSGRVWKHGEREILIRVTAKVLESEPKGDTAKRLLERKGQTDGD